MRARDTHTASVHAVYGLCIAEAHADTPAELRGLRGAASICRTEPSANVGLRPRCHRKPEADEERQESLKDETRGRKVMTRQICGDRFVRAGKETETTKKRRQKDGG